MTLPVQPDSCTLQHLLLTETFSLSKCLQLVSCHCCNLTLITQP